MSTSWALLYLCSEAPQASRVGMVVAIVGTPVIFVATALKVTLPQPWTWTSLGVVMVSTRAPFRASMSLFGV